MNHILYDISWVVPLRNELLTPIFQFFTWLGYPTFVMLLLPLGYWLWNKQVFTRVAIIVVFSTVLNAFLKDLWENPRPDLMFRLDSEVGKSFGMPSGHAQVSAVLWFWMAYEIRKLWAWVVASVAVIGICCSRIYLGIHDLEDILVGLAIAFVSLCVFRFLLTPRFLALREGPLILHLLAIVGFAIVVKLAWPPAEHSIGALVVLGLLVAWLLGANYENRLIGFSPRCEVWSLVLIALIGVAGLMVVLAAAKPLLSSYNSLVAGTFRSALLGIYMTLAAPMLFKLCKLSAPSQSV